MTYLALLKSVDYGSFAVQNQGQLPYRIDALQDAGFALRFSDSRFRWPWNDHRLNAIATRIGPILETISQFSAVWRSPVTLAMFESQGHLLALLRSVVRPLRTRRLVIVACWLADIAPSLSNRRRALYRRIYREVDLVVVFSTNQRAILERELDISAARIAVVPFGIDVSEFAQSTVSESGCVVAVGRDAGRDWPTFFTAVEGTEWDVKVACRTRQVANLVVPREVGLLGYIERDRYRALLASASVVVIATQNRAYPTGQSVMLEAMSMGKACVVTQTAAMAEYAIDEVNCLTVPLGDSDSLRTAISRLLADDSLRQKIGNEARAHVEATFNARSMWQAIGASINELAGAAQGH